MAIPSFVGYFSWMFYSTFFIRYVVNAIETGVPFHDILVYIVVVCLVTMALQLYVAYVKNVTVPIDDVKVYRQLYAKLYQKAENVELSCFEDSQFYNRYTMALDNACERITGVVGLLFDIAASFLAMAFTYVSMYQIDKVMLLFILAPLVGNFLFGMLVSKLTFRIYQETTPYTRRTEYVNRVMYLADYAKEMRLSNIFNVLRRTYDDAVERNVKIVKSYKGRNVAWGFAQYYFSYTIIFRGGASIRCVLCVGGQDDDAGGVGRIDQHDGRRVMGTRRHRKQFDAMQSEWDVYAQHPHVFGVRRSDSGGLGG